MSEPFVGEIRMFAGNFAPRGWSFCDGQLLAVSQNDALFSLLGTIYGGDGRTTFGLPDMRGRIPIHQGHGPGLSSRQLGSKTGKEKVTLTLKQLAAHTHTANANSANGTAAVASNTMVFAQATDGLEPYQLRGTGSLTTLNAKGVGNNAGGSQSHNNLMPTLCINFIIAMAGIYPSRN